MLTFKHYDDDVAYSHLSASVLGYGNLLKVISQTFSYNLLSLYIYFRNMVLYIEINYRYI